MLKENKLKVLLVLLLSSSFVYPLITYADSQSLNDLLNWYSASPSNPIKVNNTQGYSIIVSVNADVSCKYATLIHCNGSASYITPGQSYTCVTNQSVDWETASNSPGPAVPSIPTYGTYTVTSGNTQ